eukprot:1141353-Amorphochlora_amoeboformis.AAC.1
MRRGEIASERIVRRNGRRERVNGNDKDDSPRGESGRTETKEREGLPSSWSQVALGSASATLEL